jgi:hypothetical protein
MDIKEFMRNNDMFRKLEMALEEIRVGQGDEVFDGLQDGKVTVDITYNGAYIHFARSNSQTVTATLSASEPEKPHTREEARALRTTDEIKELGDATEGEESEPVTEVRKRKRYTS